jgi:hypothetical protein
VVYFPRRRHVVKKNNLPECETFPNKKQYETEGAAMDAAAFATKREGVRIHYYFCTDCNQYHLGKGRT